MIQYTYNEQTFNSISELRYNSPNIVFPPDPSKELLEGLGVKVEEVPDPELSPEQLAANQLQDAKQRRYEEVSTIVVEVDGIKFEGDERSQSRITKTLLCWDNSVETIKWIDAENNLVDVTRDQLQKALELSVRSMNEIWITPYSV